MQIEKRKPYFVPHLFFQLRSWPTNICYNCINSKSRVKTQLNIFRHPKPSVCHDMELRAFLVLLHTFKNMHFFLYYYKRCQCMYLKKKYCDNWRKFVYGHEHWRWTKTSNIFDLWCYFLFILRKVKMHHEYEKSLFAVHGESTAIDQTCF